jgi:hypothetical protein
VNNNYKNSSFDNTLFQRYNGDVDAVIQLWRSTKFTEFVW